MKRCRIFSISVIAVLFAFLAGCVTTKKKISVSEVMQQPENRTYYLAHNLWVENPRSISSINYQSGAIIPFGTEVKILKVTRESVTFKVVRTGLKYTIIYFEKYGMKPVQEYLKSLVTTKTRAEMTKGISQNTIDAMLAGRVRPGMTRREVIMTYGPPSPHRTPLLENQTWIYWVKRWPVSITSRVIFKGDKVLDVIR